MKLTLKSTLIIIFILILALISGGIIYGISHQVNTTTPEPPPSEPIAQVKTIKLHKGIIEQTLDAYGVVLPLSSKLKTLTVSYASQVEEVRVNQGQFVKQGDLLLTLRPAPSSILQWKQAQSELSAATQENKLLQQRLHLKLATQQDLVGSQLRLKQAQVTLKNLSDQGGNKKQAIRANSPGIVYLSTIQQGQILQAGAPLLQLIDKNQWMVRLGVEPEDYAQLLIDQLVFITPVNTSISKPVKGRIKLITHQIDPTTRLLNIFVKPESNQTLLMNDFVQGEIIVSSVEALLAPLQAVLPEGDRYFIFSVKDGHAIKHWVQTGLKNDHFIELIQSDLNLQDEVVVLGNYQLESGMAVSIKPANDKDGL
ncbi:MAG: efflux RND transporter periplasmic adaptor subunit [Methylophaga sp.]|nr:efflux RND transporter periplasmic adaptor subunit [Methylophaga sp.]